MSATRLRPRLRMVRNLTPSAFSLPKVLIGGELAVKHQVLRSGAAIPPGRNPEIPVPHPLHGHGGHPRRRSK